MGMKEHADDLARRRAHAAQMGGDEAVARQHAAGKLTVRERIGRLFDKDTFTEIGIHATHAGIAPDLAGRETPADGVVTGFGKIDGRLASLIAYDFTVMAGSMGRNAETKCNRAREIAYTKRIPMIWLIDSAGARIQEAIGSRWFAGSGQLFREQSIFSGVVPQVAAMMGPGAAGTAYIPALADFVPMVKGTSHMALGGPPLVKAVVGEDITAEDLGGSKIHTEISGVADLEVEDDEHCLRVIKEYLAYFPAHNGEPPPVIACDDPVDRRDEELLTIVPDSPRRAYDVRKVIRALVDHGRMLELKPAWAKNIVVALARLGGHPVGVVANQPMVLGGALDIDSADKAARFIMLCDAFGIPLVFLQDVPGFMVGSKVERAGIIRHGAKMLYAVSEATVPKLTVVMRKAYGAGYFVMCGRAVRARPDRRLADRRDQRDGSRGRHQHRLSQGDRGRRGPGRRAGSAGRGLPAADQSLHRGRRRADRRRHRPARHPTHAGARARDGPDQACRSALAQARRHAGVAQPPTT